MITLIFFLPNASGLVYAKNLRKWAEKAFAEEISALNFSHAVWQSFLSIFPHLSGGTMATSQTCCHLPGKMLNSASECADRAQIRGIVTSKYMHLPWWRGPVSFNRARAWGVLLTFQGLTKCTFWEACGRESCHSGRRHTFNCAASINFLSSALPKPGSLDDRIIYSSGNIFCRKFAFQPKTVKPTHPSSKLYYPTTPRAQTNINSYTPLACLFTWSRHLVA
jgi:hypothetical protein